MIGLVLGETKIGKLIVKKLRFLKIKYTIIDISKNKLFNKDKNSFPLSIGQLGKAISILKEKNCKKIIFAGKVSRPILSKTKFDLKALYYLPKIIKGFKKGDSYIINDIIKIFNKEKLKVISQAFYNSELLLKKGIHTKSKPNTNNKKDISIGKNIIKSLTRNNVGQAVVVRSGKIIAIEDEKGTDSMLNRAYKIIKRNSYKNKRKGILLKFPKANQDLRVDLPTVGFKTLQKCKNIGLKGVVVKADQNIFLDKQKSVSLANSNKMFIIAI